MKKGDFFIADLVIILFTDIISALYNIYIKLRKLINIMKGLAMNIRAEYEAFRNDSIIMWADCMYYQEVGETELADRLAKQFTKRVRKAMRDYDKTARINIMWQKEAEKVLPARRAFLNSLINNN